MWSLLEAIGEVLATIFAHIHANRKFKVISCDKCGGVTTVPKDSPPETLACNKCGASLAGSAKPPTPPKEYLSTKKNVLCKKCGQMNAVWSDSPAEMRVCTVCGTVLARSEYAGFWVRLGAAIVDSVVFGFIWFILIFIFIIILPDSEHGKIPPLALLALPLYHWSSTAINGRTLGKTLFRIRVVDDEGNKPGLGHAALREVMGKPISTAILFMGFLWIAFDQQKQGWHDIMARTYVVKARPKQAG